VGPVSGTAVDAVHDVVGEHLIADPGRTGESTEIGGVLALPEDAILDFGDLRLAGHSAPIRHIILIPTFADPSDFPGVVRRVGESGLAVDEFVVVVVGVHNPAEVQLFERAHTDGSLALLPGPLQRGH